MTQYSSTVWPAMRYDTDGENPSQTYFPGPGNYNGAVVDDDPSVFWPLNESSGAVATDDSGNGRDGTYNAPVTLGVAGMLSDEETAIEVDDATGAGGVTRSAATGAGPVGSIEMWMKPTQISGVLQNALSAFNSGTIDGVGIVTNTDGTVLFCDIIGGVITAFVTSPVIAVNQLVHLALTFNGTTLVAYVDGSPIGSVAAGPIAGAWDFFGLASNAFGGETHGIFEKIALYPVALTAAQIAAHYAAGSAGGAPVVEQQTSPPLEQSSINTTEPTTWPPLPAPAPVVTTYVPAIQTTDAIRAFFNIQPPLGTVNVNAVASDE